ncbi:MAG: NUDIX domain-containing protein [archaeon]
MNNDYNNKEFIVIATALIFNTARDKFIAIKRNKNEKTWPNKWDLPGGKVESGETLEQGLIREIFEETGISIRIEKYIASYSWKKPDGVNALITFFIASANTENLELKEDFEDCKWISTNEFENYEFIPKISEILKIAIDMHNYKNKLRGI